VIGDWLFMTLKGHNHSPDTSSYLLSIIARNYIALRQIPEGKSVLSMSSGQFEKLELRSFYALYDQLSTSLFAFIAVCI
jgi:hypothetical protein